MALAPLPLWGGGRCHPLPASPPPAVLPKISSQLPRAHLSAPLLLRSWESSSLPAGDWGDWDFFFFSVQLKGKAGWGFSSSKKKKTPYYVKAVVLFFKGKNTTTTASEFAFKVALERVGLREHLHILGQEPHTASDVVGSHSSEEPALGESLRTELGSADLLPASGLMSCPFARRT